jgi:predicted TIM-barrel fold metal-dependent hydrolase
LAGSYDQVTAALQAVMKPHLNKQDEIAVFGGNAARFYKLVL